MRPALMHIESLEIGYRSNIADAVSLLQPISIMLREGDFIALMGPNGAGKSTLLRTLAGMHPQIAGQISIKGKAIDAMSRQEISSLIGMVLTDRIDDFFLTVYVVVSMGRYPYTGFWGTLADEDHQAIRQSLALVGVLELSGRTMINLSDGERQKVMIAKALAQDTPIILLDEPAAFLDYPSKIELMQLLRKLAHIERKTILFSSHDLDLALSNADRLWLIGQQMPLQDGLPEQLVLDGVIGDYFNRGELVFDPAIGKFPGKQSNGIQIQMSGEGIYADWLKHALQRNGYQLVKEPAPHSVSVDNKQYCLIIQNKERIFTTKIEDIIHELSKI
jgi:iron complex transport system ATP-binding protein